MKSHNISLVSSLVLIVMSTWGYLSSETPSVTALIPLFFGVILILCYPGINKENKIYADRNMSYFINQGYELVLQETRGIRTAYVLKKGKDYVGCRTESLSKKETCYIIEIIKAE